QVLPDSQRGGEGAPARGAAGRPGRGGGPRSHGHRGDRAGSHGQRAHGGAAAGGRGRAGHRHRRARPRRGGRRGVPARAPVLMYAFLRGLMRTIVHVYLGGLFGREGLVNVPLRGGVLVCPNHQSTIDPPLVPAFLPRSDTWSMAKSDYFEKGWQAWLFRRYQAFPVV